MMTGAERLRRCMPETSGWAGCYERPMTMSPKIVTTENRAGGGSRLVLGIDVEPDLLHAWRSWLMPAIQPFVIPRGLAAESDWPEGHGSLVPELRDAFELYSISETELIVWLSRSQARALPASVRKRQPGAHRWPTENAARDIDRAVRYVEHGRRLSRHHEVTDAHWESIQTLLPGAHGLAGHFPRTSGPNCFGTVMGVAGVRSAATEWMQIDPFEDWLGASTRRGGSVDAPGTVLVWRDRNERAVHAAITIGNGWVIHKPSQGWMSPVKVLTVRDGMYSARSPGWHVTRYQLRDLTSRAARSVAPQ
jgi:hypothetical protein